MGLAYEESTIINLFILASIKHGESYSCTYNKYIHIEKIY